MFPKEDNLLKACKSVVAFGLILCLFQLVMTFVVIRWPNTEVQGRKSRSMVRIPLAMKDLLADFSKEEAQDLFASDFFSLPKKWSELLQEEKEREANADKTYLQQLEEEKFKQQLQEKMLDDYRIDGIIWGGEGGGSVVILRQKKTLQRLHLKERALLHGWSLYRIKKRAVVFRLQKDSSLFHTLEIEV
jgi:hypothetical protein